MTSTKLRYTRHETPEAKLPWDEIMKHVLPDFGLHIKRFEMDNGRAIKWLDLADIILDLGNFNKVRIVYQLNTRTKLKRFVNQLAKHYCK